MQLKYLKTVISPQGQISRIPCLAWSPNHQKLAVATADRVVLLFDENGERRDKFSTKPSDPANGKNSYIIRDLAFSPDSSRLAVAQSDNIVFVYKLGESWNEKKVICNKFPQNVAVKCMVWLSGGMIIAGLEYGSVKSLNCKTNKSQNLYGMDSSVVSLAPNPKGTGILSGHEDGSVIRYIISDDSEEQSGRIIEYQGIPLALAWAQAGICVTGADKKVHFYDNHGKMLRIFDYTRDDTERDFTAISCSPNGQSIALGSYDRIRIFTWISRQNAWTEASVKDIKNIYTVTAMGWKKDGSRLTIGTLCGAVYLFEFVLRRTLYQDKFELTYIAPTQVLIKTIQEPIESMTVESPMGYEIDDVRIMGRDSYLVARTDQSLILCDLIRSLQSEIQWNSSGRHERFYFENPNVCLIFNAGELSLVEYGDNYVLGTVRTEFVNPHVISVRLNERGTSKNNKKLAYLLDLKTICVIDLIFQTTIIQISNDSKIDWIELNETGNKLLFRDRKMRLMLVDINTGRKQNLLCKVAFVQWVIQSDVAVAQTDSNLIVWYNIDMPEHVTVVPIRGDVLEVTREEGKTEVHSTDGAGNYVYQLDEGLVEFGTALNDSDFGRAISFLESLGDKPAATAMWYNLANVAMQKENLIVAQRCYAALGNVTKALYLQETREIADKFEETHGPGIECPEVKARIAMLNADLRLAEQIYLENGDIESALSMYKMLRRWDEALTLAERRGYDQIDSLRDEQMTYLLSSGQEEKAGKVLEDRGESDKAMVLYLKANKPAKAARLAFKNNHILQNDDQMSKLSALLIKAELFELAGDLAQRLNNLESAIQMYRKGGAYARAIDLARTVSPDDVINLEEEWGDWLVSKRQLDASISHYIEAGATVKALEASVSAKQWKKAVQIAKVLDDPVETKKYALELSNHLAFTGDISGAESLLLRAELYREAVDFLNKQGQWERAYDVASEYLEPSAVKDMFLTLAQKLESEGKYKDCEKVYITMGEPDSAISLYKRLENYDAMIRLVEKYHRDLLENTHLHLAKQLESRGKYKTSEVHYLAAGDWKSAVHMFCNIMKWEDAHRIAKQKGGENAANQVAYMWAKSLPIESAARLLTKMGLIDSALTFSCEARQFEFALQLSQATGRSQDEIYLKWAMALEDDGKFEEAEQKFLLANKPKEAIMMHTHSGDWTNAIRIAEAHIPEAVNEILINQAASALETRNYPEYEALLIRAERPELILDHYKEYGMWSDALRIAKEYVHSAVPEIQRLQDQESRSSANSDYRNILSKASEFARSEEFKKAADQLLKINSSNADNATVEKSLIRAAEICNQFLEGSDSIEIARQLGPRLVALNQIGPAAQLYLAAEMPKEAVDVFIVTENWAKARRLAKEIDPQMVTYVEKEQKHRLKNEGNVEQLADIDIIGALDLLAEQGQWTRCIEKAKQHSGPVLQKYLALYATQLIRDGNCIAALNIYLNHGSPANLQNFNIYNRIALECFSMRETDAGMLWKDLRTFLYQITLSIKNSENVPLDVVDRFDLLLLISHYYATRFACRQVQALQSVAVKISTALLRYTEIIPVDKGFYEAGMDLRSIGRESEAFVILNHYLDICEAIDEGTGNLVDHSDLTATDFPSSVPIPEELHLKNELKLHEEVREWVLAVSMDQKVDQTLPMDDRNLYESSLGISDQPCVITGYPVTGRQPVSFQRSSRMANREFWSKLIVSAKMAPTSNVPDVIEFSEKWLGPANFISV